MSSDNASGKPQDFEIVEIVGDFARGQSKCFDDDGHPERSGNVCSASAHEIVAAVIGSGVLPLAWATAQLGWIAGPTVLFLFSFVTYYTSCLLAACYRSGDPVTGKRNYSYMEAVQNNLGGFQVKICGFIQYFNVVGVAIGYTIAASTSAIAVKRSTCFHEKGLDTPCHVYETPYMVMFGVVEIFLSQIPDDYHFSGLSVIMTIVLSFTYSFIGLGLGISKVAENGKIKGSLSGIKIGKVTPTEKIWQSFEAVGAIAFAYSYSLILIEIQDTLRSPPAEHKTMNRATLISIATTTIFYLFWGCFGYAAFGDSAPGNLLTGFGSYNAYWLIEIANVAIVINLVGAYQVNCQSLFAFIENTAAKYFPESKFINNSIKIPIPIRGYQPYKLNFFRLIWRSIFVCLITVIAILIPVFNDVVGILGAFGFWPLSVYFPVEMYIVQKKIPKWSTRWVTLQILSVACLIIAICAAAGSFAGVVHDLKIYQPFETTF